MPLTTDQRREFLLADPAAELRACDEASASIIDDAALAPSAPKAKSVVHEPGAFSERFEIEDMHELHRTRKYKDAGRRPLGDRKDEKWKYSK